MKLLQFALILAFLKTFSLIAQQQKPFVIGETVQFHSSVLSEDRNLNIYLPRGYHPDSVQTYPVIYLLDGSADEDFIHIAGLVQFLSFSWINSIPETIVVGVVNVDRKRDFTFPTTVEQDQLDYPTTGSSGKFIQFLDQELMPYIEKNYKVNSQKTIIGQSLGGLLVSEILFENPNLFDNYFIISPSLWWDNGSLLSRNINPDIAGKKIYIAVGNEGKEMVIPAEKFYKMLEKYDASDTELYFQYFKNKTHGDVLHQAVYDGFEIVFSEE